MNWMRSASIVGLISLLAMLGLEACSPAIVTPPQATEIAPQTTQAATLATATPPPVTATAPAATQTAPLVTEEPNPYPLSDPGPYHVGMRSFTAEDASRDNRPVSITVWYPALLPEGSTRSDPAQDADPDPSGAPYPLIISSTKFASTFAPYLVSHGFTWASVDGIDTYFHMYEQMFEQPRDILFALDQVAANPPEGLEGMIDAEHTGAIGYSFDGYNTLAMSGARIDPELYLAQCPVPDETIKPIVESGLSAFNCYPAEHWDEFNAQAGEAITASEDGLWQPITDERIRAVMPLAGEGWWLFGENGLATVDRPVLNLMGTEDELYPENALIFEHLGTTDKSFISFVGQDHMMVRDPEIIPHLAHFIAAFFGYHLQDRPELAEFYSQDFVAQHADLAWGVVEDTDKTDFPLSETGPYFVGYRSVSYFDESRAGKEVPVTVWYPALQETDADGRVIAREATADLSGAPYPLIISSSKSGRTFAPYLVSHGFAWAGVDDIDSYMQMNEQMYEQPLDILFALDQVASDPPIGLEGVIDAEHAGAIGYSFDGYNTYAMSGARIDPELYLAQCPTPDETIKPIVESGVSAFNCDPAEHWDAFTAQAGEAITESEDGLWQPITDERIRAVMPLAGEGWWLFGERGLAAVDRPTLILVATNDELYTENALMFEHLGTPDRALISFVGRDHMMIFEPKMVARMAHFAAAFFGTHLQGRPELAEFYSQDFVAQHDDLAWGVVEGE